MRGRSVRLLAWCGDPYSPECVEYEFWEVRRIGSVLCFVVFSRYNNRWGCAKMCRWTDVLLTAIV